MSKQVKDQVASGRLTAIQRDLLASHKAFPEKGHQNAVFLIQFDEEVDARRLAKSFDSVVAQSDALRSLVSLGNGTGIEIAAQPPVKTKLVKKTKVKFEEWATNQACLPLDLSTAAYESVIATHSRGQTSWYLNLHHLVNDGLSAALVLRAVEAAYDGSPLTLPEFYSLDRSEAAASAEKDAARKYWQDRKPSPRIDRIYDNLNRTSAAAEQLTVLSGIDFNNQLDAGLNGPYRLLTEGLSRAAFWVFTTALYLNRLSGADEFSIGVIVNHRERLAASDVIGPMVEIFPVNVIVREDDTHQTLHKRTSEAFFQTLKNAQPGTAPVQDYDALVNVLPDMVAPKKLFGVPAKICWLYSGSLDAAVPLRIMDTPYAPPPGGSAGEQRRIDVAITDDARGNIPQNNIAHHFEAVVNQALTAPTASIFGYSLISDDEQELLTNWGSEPPLKRDFVLPTQLETILKGNSKVVLIENDQKLTGDELWQWSLKFAGHLDRANAPTRIGVQMTPSIQSLVAIYGILLSGRSYVPIEPISPQARIENIISLTELEYVIETLDEVDDQRFGTAAEMSDWNPDDEAYVFFTSGSSGTPRGVAISRAGLDNYLNVIVDRVRRRAGAPIAPLFGSLSFDITVNMLFAPILAGGTLVVFGGNPADAMVRIAKTQNLTWLQATPSHLELLVRLLPKDHSLRTIISGGDALGGRLAKLLDQSNPDANLLIVNYYGPTETVVGCIDYELSDEDRLGTDAVPIGRPLPGAVLAMMDPHGNPVPVGAVGELWISFPHMMEAYIGWEPEASGILDHEGTKFYRSGDLVQYRQDGNILFHGRADDQMKIGGIRIDANEIEEALTAHSKIRRSVVRLHEDNTTNKPVLTAWIQPEGKAPSVTALRRHLGSRVPRFAIPHAFVEIETVPLTSAGKVDVRELPAPASKQSASKAGSKSTGSELELKIVDVWNDVLDTKVTSLDDDFFALGGDSLAALEMILILAKELDQKLDERLAFQETTPASLAQAIRRSQDETPHNVHAPQAEQMVRVYTDNDPPPFTDNELAILLHHRVDPDSDRYNGGRVFSLDGRFDAEKLRRAITLVVARHVPLTWSYGTPRRRLSPDQHFAFSHSEEPVELAVALTRAEKIRQRPFDLEQGPILRCHVQTLTENRTAIALMGHHVGFDQASFNTLLRQITETYQSSSMPKAMIDYPSTVAAMQAKCETGAHAYWRALEIPEQAPLVPMKTDTNQTDQGAYITRQLTVHADKIRRAEGGPIAHRALAAAAIAVSPLVDGTAIDLSLVSSRKSQPSDDLVGCTVNPLPLWLSCQPTASVQEIMDQSASHVASLMPYRHFPLLQVDAARREAGKTFETPRFFVSVIEISDETVLGSKVQETLLSTKGAVGPMSFFLVLDHDATSIGLEYDRRIFPDIVATRVLENFSKAVEAVVNTPDKSIQSIAPSPQDSSNVLIGEKLNEYPNLFSQISKHLKRGGDGEAIVCGDEIWDWEVLAKHTLALAAKLESAGIGPGSRVAISLPRGPLFIAGILATMNCRAAYVPIDINYPTERINAILKAAKPELCLVETAIFDEPEMLVTNKGVDNEEWASIRPAKLKQPLDSDVAYIMFTSGSTGTPVGVAINHGQLSHSTNARNQVYKEAPTRFGLFSSFAFDSSVVGLYWTLAHEGCIVLPKETVLRDPHKLVEVLGDGLSHVLMVPTLYSALLPRSERPWPNHVILAGEAVTLDLAKRHFDAFPRTALTNEYGPTEGTVWSLHRHIGPKDVDIPIGHPIPGTWAAVVDTKGQPCANGIVGELVIGGPLIADGYINELQSTKGKFFTTKTSLLPAGTAFKTGDRAAVGANGVYFLGRADDQLNVGGVRLEPGEVEAALLSEAGVEAAIVLACDRRDKDHLLADASLSMIKQAVELAEKNKAQEDALEVALRSIMPTEDSLIAHIQADSAIDLADLRQRVAARLPVLLRPAHYVIHTEFPQTPNGKIDRRKLIEMSTTESPSVPAIIEPKVEDDSNNVAVVTEIFRKALKSSSIGPDDSFFEFGGYSLLAIRVLLEIEERIGLRLSTADFYDHPTARGLCSANAPNAATDSQPSSNAELSSRQTFVFPYCRTGNRAPIFAIHNLEANGSLFRPLSKRLGPNQPMYGIGHADDPDMTGHWVRDPNWHVSVEDVASHYIDELEKLAPTGPIVLMGSCLGAVYAYEMAQQLQAKGRTPHCLIMLNDLHAPELGIRTKSRKGVMLTLRLDQLRRAELSHLPYMIRKIPVLAKRGMDELKRNIEIRQLSRARAKGETLSQKLQVRQFIERSFVEVHDYKYLPYSGRVAIVREQERTISHGSEDNRGWGTLIPNSQIDWVTAKAFQTMMTEPHVAGVSAVVERELESTIIPEATVNPSTDVGQQTLFKHNVSKDDYRIAVEFSDKNFINSPRPEQRDWLVQLRMKELSAELENLDLLAPTMIAADGTIEITNRGVSKLTGRDTMEDWMIPLMQRMADAIALPDTDILEVGYGRGVSAAMVQNNNVSSHTIVECNSHVVEEFEQWRMEHPGKKIKMIEGLWQDVIDEFERYDGILFHTYPLSTDELIENLEKYSTFAEDFFPVAAGCLNPGGRFTYFTNEADSLSRSHQRALLKHFDSFTISRLDGLEIPEGSADAHWYDTIVVVQALAPVG